jgi:hypothetical protein
MREIRTSGSQRGKATSDPSGVPSLLYCEIRAICGFETLLIHSDSNQGTCTIFILPGVTKEHERLWFLTLVSSTSTPCKFRDYCIFQDEMPHCAQTPTLHRESHGLVPPRREG